MNRREFLQRVPACASVPALLSLPLVKAQTRLVKPWLRELEAKIAEIPESFWRASDPRMLFIRGLRHPVRSHQHGIDYSDRLTGYNLTPIGNAPALHVNWCSKSYEDAFVEMDFYVQNFRGYRFTCLKGEWRATSNDIIRCNMRNFPPVDFYSL